MSAPVICYPYSFLERPEDRSFLIELGIANVPGDTARLMLYRIWADFATGGSDRRVLASPENLGKDRLVRVLESFCGWSGEPGLLVRMGVESGFLQIERGGDITMLVCHGFFPINSAWTRGGNSFQKRGAYTRIKNKQASLADAEASKREELWQRTGTTAFSEFNDDERKSALRFIIRICRALGLKIPADSVLAAGPFRMAAECLRASSEKEIDDTLLWLISKRQSPDISDRLDVILRGWSELMKKAASEIS
jgi:hypothetical protein